MPRFARPGDPARPKGASWARLGRHAVARRADLAAIRLLGQHRAARPPIDVDELAAALAITVVLRAFEDADVSGMLFRGEHEVIGVNTS